VHSQTPFTMGFEGMLAARLSKYPLVGSFHTLLNHKSLSVYFPKSIKPLYKYMWKYVKFFYRRCDTVIVPSNTIASKLKKYKVGNISVVPNGIDTSVFNTKVSPEKALKSFGLDDSKRRILYLGRLSKEKNIDVFIKAAAKLAKKDDGIEFVIGGTGPFSEYYKRLAARLGLGHKIKFLGFVSQELLPSLYAASDAFCMPSTFETQGIVCLEAMALGKPVIAAETPVLNEFVKNGYNGERFKAKNYLDCARKIERVLNNSEAYRKGALSTAKEFSLEKVTDELISVYKDTIKKAVY